MDIYERRRIRLRELIDQKFGGKISQLAEALDMKPPMISRWLSTTTAAPRRMTEMSARSIEGRLGLPSGYLDSAETPDQSIAEVMSLMQNMSPQTRATVVRMVQLLVTTEREYALPGAPESAHSIEISSVLTTNFPEY